MSSDVARKKLIRWLTTVFPRLGSAGYDQVSDFSISRAFKNDASTNSKKKRKQLICRVSKLKLLFP